MTTLEKRWTSAAGYDCVVAVVSDFGTRVGYVCVPSHHPWHGWDYWDLPVEVHGGITFAGIPRVEGVDDGWWFGFDCAHVGDYIPDFERMKREEPDVWARIKELADRIARPFLDTLDPLGEAPDEVLENDVLGYWTPSEAVDEAERLALNLAIAELVEGKS